MLYGYFHWSGIYITQETAKTPVRFLTRDFHVAVYGIFCKDYMAFLCLTSALSLAVHSMSHSLLDLWHLFLQKTWGWGSGGGCAKVITWPTVLQCHFLADGLFSMEQ